MEGTAKRQVNAEEMLAELKRALESSTPAPSAPPSSASMATKSRSSGPEPRRPQIDKGSDRPAKANADKSIGPRTDLQKSTRPSFRSWKLIAGGLVLAGAAVVGTSFALMNKASDPAEREPSAAATESLVRPQNEQTLKPSSDSRSLMEDSQRAAPLQAGALAAPASTPAPLDEAPALAPSIRIGLDGAPIATAPSTPASTDSAHPAETPKPAAAPAAPQMVKPDGASIATAPSAPASTDSAHPAETPKPNATPTAHVSKESTQPSTRKIDSKKKPVEKASLQKPLRSPTPPVKPIAQAERQSTEPARPKEAERSPQPTQDNGNPAAVAPAASPSVPQRVADGVTHAFGYLVHLPGALVPRLGGSNPDAH
jgi:hypothetical protein